MASRTAVASTTVPASQAAVWELVCDTARYAAWVEGTDEVVRTDGEARAGSTYDERNTVIGPVKARSGWTVAEHEPPRRTLHRGEGIWIADDVSIEMTLEPAGERATRLTLAFRYTPRFGPLGRLLAAAGLHRHLEAGFERSLRRLAEIAAQEHGAAAA